MALPLSPEEQARVDAYWGSGPQSLASTPAPSAPTEEQVSAYFGPPAPPPAAPLPYQPNPGLPGYNPNPGSTTEVAPQPPPVPMAALSPPTLSPQAQEFKPGADLSGAPMHAAPPAAPIAPSAGQNAAFEQYKAGLATSKPAAAPARAPGAPGNPDPYGILAAQKQQVGAMGNRMDAMGRASAAEGDQAVMRADHNANLARMQEEDAAIANSEREYAAKHFDESMSEIGRQLDDVKAKKIDPLRLFKESPGLGVMAVIGGAVSGFYQGISGGAKNEFIEDLNQKIDRGIAEDERQIRDEKFTLSEGTNLLHQQRQAWKDDALAKMQQRNLAYEAAKGEIAAEAERQGTPIAKAHADEAIEQVRQQQGALLEDIGRKNQALAAAAAARGLARSKEVNEAFKNYYEKNLASGMEPGQALDWARHLVGLTYAPGTPGNSRPESVPQSGMTKEQRGKINMEHGEAQLSSDEFNAQVDDLKKHPVLGQLGLTTGAASHLGQRLAPESASIVQDLQVMNTQVLQAVGKVAKDADGKPNKTMIDKLEQRFEIHPTDTKEIALQKLEGARDAVNALARQQGASRAPKPGAQRAQDEALGAKPVR